MCAMPCILLVNVNHLVEICILVALLPTPRHGSRPRLLVIFHICKIAAPSKICLVLMVEANVFRVMG